MFGSPKTTSGGNALKFYASIRLEITPIGQIKKGDESHGNRTRVKVVKNKVAPPFRKCEFDIYFGRGILREAELLDLGIDSGIVRKSGSWYSIEEQRVGQGRDNAIGYLAERPELAERVRLHILEHLGLLPPAEATEA